MSMAYDWLSEDLYYLTTSGSISVIKGVFKEASASVVYSRTIDPSITVIKGMALNPCDRYALLSYDFLIFFFFEINFRELLIFLKVLQMQKKNIEYTFLNISYLRNTNKILLFICFQKMVFESRKCYLEKIKKLALVELTSPITAIFQWFFFNALRFPLWALDTYSIYKLDDR